jgi:hypothetical protein
VNGSGEVGEGPRAEDLKVVCCRGGGVELAAAQGGAGQSIGDGGA